MTVYLLHFEERLHHAQHYLGSAEDLEHRLAEHRRARRHDGRGHELVAVMRERGVAFELARTWPGGRKKEKALKSRKEGPRLCPICMNLKEAEKNGKEKN